MSIKPSIHEKFIIESADGERTVDISRGVTAFFYYENLFSPYLTARIIVTNTGSTIKGKDGKLQSLYNGLPVRGGERLQIKIAGNSPTNKGLDFADIIIALSNLVLLNKFPILFFVISNLIFDFTLLEVFIRLRLCLENFIKLLPTKPEDPKVKIFISI